MHFSKVFFRFSKFYLHIQKPKLFWILRQHIISVFGNENKILNEIYENRDDKTLIIISHRNNTVKYCDLIYVLEDGKLIDQGSFKEIINKYGYLKEMNIK